MLYFVLFLTAGGIVALDQLTKYLTVTHIPMYQTIPAIDGLFHFTYILNTGAAFSMLEGKMWFFFLITAVYLVVIGLVIWKKWVTHPLGLVSLAMITGGAIGNVIDRATIGAVVDMIELEFMNFAVFNVADCFIVVGAVLLCVWALFFDKKPKETQDDC